MPNNSKFTIERDAETVTCKLITPRYTVTDNGFSTLISWVAQNGRLPTDNSLQVTESFSREVVNLYESIRFKQAMEKMNEFAIVTTYEIYKEMSVPFIKNIKVMEELGLVKYVNSLSSLLNVEVMIFNNEYLLSSWNSNISLRFPIKVPILNGCDSIGASSYPYLQNPEWTETYKVNKKRLIRLNDMHRNFVDKIQNHTYELIKMFQSHSTTKQILENITPDISYDILTLAFDTVFAIRESGYGSSGILKPLYTLDKMEQVYKDNDFAVKLIIEPVKKAEFKLKAVS